MLLRHCFRDALILPFQHPQVAPPPQGFRGGLVLPNDPAWDPLRHTRYGKPVDAAYEPATSPEPLQGRFVYAGGIYHHFGHILSEFVHRIVPSQPLDQNQHWLLVYTPKHPNTRLSLFAQHVQEIYGFLGVTDENSFIVTQPVQVEELLVSESGSDFGRTPKPGYLQMLKEYSHRRLADRFAGTKRWSRVYVSRAAYIDGGFLGERHIETLFESAGFMVFRPEEHPFDVQMDVYRCASLLVFSEGSACHGLELLGDGLGEMVLLNRRKDHQGVFRAVLASRARRFHSLNDNFDLGTMVQSASGTPYGARGVSLFNLPALGELMQQIGHPLPPLRINDYLAAAEADLLAYDAAAVRFMKRPVEDGLRQQVHAQFRQACAQWQRRSGALNVLGKFFRILR